VRRVHAGGDEAKYAIPDDGVEAYLHSCQERMGAAYFQTPRDTVKDFVGLLNVLQQNPGADWRALVGQIKTAAPPDRDPAEAQAAAADVDDDDLATFKM
jgi:hypothetical protein